MAGPGLVAAAPPRLLRRVRAEPFADGAAEWVDLEAWLMQRAAGMAFDAPAVRPQ